jgi:hypothetical protein
MSVTIHAHPLPGTISHSMGSARIGGAGWWTTVEWLIVARLPAPLRRVVQPKFNKAPLGWGMPTEPLLAESELRFRVLRRIRKGRLPVMLSTTLYAGYGQGERCDLCDQHIPSDKIECDVTDPHGGKRLHFHFACHAAWQRECVLLLRDRPAPLCKPDVTAARRRRCLVRCAQGSTHCPGAAENQSTSIGFGRE